MKKKNTFEKLGVFFSSRMHNAGFSFRGLDFQGNFFVFFGGGLFFCFVLNLASSGDQI